MNQAIVFGSHDHLLGVWNDATGSRNPDTAAIMVTAGMLHHAGPFRLHVEIAKGLSSNGIPSFRFDLSGIGESLGVGASGDSLTRASNEISQAIDWIHQQSGIRKVILFGLCSGADDAVHAATIDSRVVGVVAMDGCGYRTLGFHWHRLTSHFLPRLFRMGKWRATIARRLRSSETSPRSLQPGSDVREFPSRDSAAIELKSLADQGVHVHFFYTGGVGDYYNHAAQFAAMFPELNDVPRITHAFFPEMDHVALLVEDRQKLVRHVVSKVRDFAEVQPSGVFNVAEIG